MKKKLLSLATLAGLMALVWGVTTAYFSDTETSRGNIFQAGAIDLKIDNESYLNWGPEGEFIKMENLSWDLSDLTDQLFFNFDDLKPGDLGEDTISIHVGENDAYVCAYADITANDDETCTEPELAYDATCSPAENPDPGQGELADQLYFFFWADDGDNVYEDGENPLMEGPASDVLNGKTWALADSQNNPLGDSPLKARENEEDKVYYIGKAWCFGNLTTNPVAQDDTKPDVRQDTGVYCDGQPVDNSAQTDVLMGDIQFYAEQSRHNQDFLCSEVQFPITPPVR